MSLTVAVIAVGLAVAGWFRPSLADDASPTFTAKEANDAKANVCTAYGSVRDAVIGNTNMANPGEENPIGGLAVAANARLALSAGGAHLHDLLAAEPAAPTELRQTIDATANTLQELGIGYLAGHDAALDPLRDELNSQMEHVDGLC